MSATELDAAREDRLMQQARRGNDIAMEQLYELTARALYNYLRRLGCAAPDADDLLQTTFMNAWRGRRQFRGDGARAWLFTIARNAFLSTVRRERAPLEMEPAPLQTPAEALAAGDLAQQLEHALAGLPAASREALVLSRVSGLSTREIASVLDMTEANARVRIHRGLAELKARIES